MKIKSDFVTNSSSSSFVVMGTYINSSILTKEHVDKINKSLSRKMTFDEIQKDFANYIDILLEKTDLDSATGATWDYNPDIMIGIHYTDMNEDETLGQFKSRVSNQIKENLGVEIKPGHIEVAWEDR